MLGEGCVVGLGDLGVFSNLNDSAQEAEGCGMKAVSPWLGAEEWLPPARWSTHKSPTALNMSGSSEKPVLQGESSSHILSLGVPSIRFPSSQ